MLRKFCVRLVIASFLVFIFSTLALATPTPANQTNIFSQKDISIEANQTIDHLLVANGNAFVKGIINEGIIVIDGNLTIAPTAKVNGHVFVLGGELADETGLSAKASPVIISPQKFSFTSIVVGTLFGFALVSLIIIPYLILGTLWLLEKSVLYSKCKRLLLIILQRWPVLYISLTLAVSGFMLVLFSELAWKTVFRQTMSVFDNVIIWFIRYFASPNLDQIMTLITTLGNGSTYILLVLAILTVLALCQRWIELAGLVICLSGSAVLNELLKHMFMRTRPADFRLITATGYSFPSGHAMVSLCFYGIMAFLIARNIHSWRWRLALGIGAALLIIIIGVSRIYLGVHYPSDVVAGYMAGATWLFFSIFLIMWWEHNHRKTAK